MKKKFTTLSFLFLVVQGIWAQECDPAPSYVQDFETVAVPALPDCSTSPDPGGANTWVTADNPGSGFENKTLHYQGGDQPAEAWFFTNGVHMNANTYYKISYKYGNNSTDTTESLVVTKGTSPEIATAEAFSTHEAITGGAPTTQLIEFYMNNVEGTYYFGFHATSGANQGSLYVDDIIIEETICGVPTNVQVSAITQSTATVTWEAPTGSNIGVFSVYQYAIAETNELPEGGTFYPSTSVNLTELEPGATYFVFTRSLCGPVWSDWTEAVEFTTPVCDPVAVPYYQDFESAATPDAPECTVIVAGESGNDWLTSNNPGNGFENNTLQYTAGEEAADAWFFTQGVEMAAGTNYKLTYTYGNNSTETTENLKIIVASSPNSASAVYTVNELEITGGEEAIYTSSILGVPSTGVYYIGFNANSDASQGNLYIDNIEVEDWDCGVPQNIAVSGITSTSATIAWETPEENTSFGYLVAHTTENTAPESGEYVAGLTKELTELEPGTTYYIFVKSQCGPLMGEWAEAIEFTTPVCEAVAVPYYQDFESAVTPDAPECTVIVAGESGNDWVTSNNPGSGFENNTLQYTAGEETADAWFFTQGIELTAGSHYKLTYTYGNDSDETTESLKVVVANSPNSASAIYTVNELEVTGGEQTVYTSSIIGAPTTGVYYIGFQVNSDAGQGNLYIDNIEVEDWDCGVPENITVSGITGTSATITWETPEENTSFGYLVAHVTENTAPESGEYVTGLTKELTELEPGTTYYIFVKSQCGPLTGEWAEAVSFTTPACEATGVPYSLDFESAVVPGVPDCTIAAEPSAGNSWATTNNPGNGFENNALHYKAGDAAADAWFYTQGINLVAGTLYKVSYTYGNDSEETTEKLKVTLNNNPNPDWTLGDFGNHDAITGGVPATNTVEYFNVTESGVYYFGFQAYSEEGQSSLYVDNFLIEEMVCGIPTDVTVDNITDTSADISWDVPGSGNSTPTVYQYAYGTTDTPPDSGTYDEDMAVSLDELTPETTYYVFTRTQCGPLWSDWTVTSFTTEATAGIGNPAFNGFTFYPNPVKDVVTLSNTTRIEAVEVYNMTGQLVHKQNVGNEHAEIGLQRLPAGAYIMNVSAEGASKQVKIIKQ